MHPDRRAVLIELRAHLERIGMANDAQDHGDPREAERLRAESCDAIRGLLTRHVFLGELLPTLAWELESGHILGFGWSNLADSADAWLQVTGLPPG